MTLRKVITKDLLTCCGRVLRRWWWARKSEPPRRTVSDRSSTCLSATLLSCTLETCWLCTKWNFAGLSWCHKSRRPFVLAQAISLVSSVRRDCHVFSCALCRHWWQHGRPRSWEWPRTSQHPHTRQSNRVGNTAPMDVGAARSVHLDEATASARPLCRWRPHVLKSLLRLFVHHTCSPVLQRSLCEEDIRKISTRDTAQSHHRRSSGVLRVGFAEVVAVGRPEPQAGRAQ